MLEAARQIEQITIVDLYAEYPRLDIDVDREQRHLVEHDMVILQFPLQWYSTPSILKEWQDVVLEHGFAYGETGNALKGKPWLCVVTAGAPEDSYAVDGRHRWSLRNFLTPLEATANLCGMPFLAPYVLFGARDVGTVACQAHVDGYVQLLQAVRDDRFSIEAAQRIDLILASRLGQVITAVRP